MANIPRVVIPGEVSARPQMHVVVAAAASRLPFRPMGKREFLTGDPLPRAFGALIGKAGPD